MSKILCPQTDNGIVPEIAIYNKV